MTLPGSILVGSILFVLLAQEGAERDIERSLQGWTIRIPEEFLAESVAVDALELLDVKLYEITRVVPPAALAKLRKVVIYLHREDPHGRHACAVYHPSAGWLSSNGYDPRMAGCVEIASARRFLRWTLDQPWMVLHELAHAYHHQFVGHDHEGLKATFARAVEGGNYDEVMRYNGSVARHYALNNVQEFFAEATEAYFGTNDYYPFVRAELARHDPEVLKVVAEVWGLDAPKRP